VKRAVRLGDRHQVVLYLLALGVGAAVGVLLPAVARPLEFAITPLLGVLLYATFLGVPIDRLARAFVDARFLGVVLAVNFVLVPLIVFGLSRFVADDPALLVGVLLVLLTPCVDYVIVFSGLAGSSADRLLAATPILMLGQIALLPAYLLLMAGSEAVAAFDAGPFLQAFLTLVVLPLGLAAVTQTAARRIRIFAVIRSGMLAAMVPLMMLTLAVVVASQVSAVGASAASLIAVVPIFIVFAVIAAPLAALAARVAGMDVPDRRAVTFSGVTRNSLVVLPLALALPAPLALAPLVVVTQTLVELVVMVVMVAAVPRLIRSA
jgi:arsenite transporter